MCIYIYYIHISLYIYIYVCICIYIYLVLTNFVYCIVCVFVHLRYNPNGLPSGFRGDIMGFRGFNMLDARNMGISGYHGGTWQNKIPLWDLQYPLLICHSLRTYRSPVWIGLFIQVSGHSLILSMLSLVGGLRGPNQTWEINHYLLPQNLGLTNTNLGC